MPGRRSISRIRTLNRDYRSRQAIALGIVGHQAVVGVVVGDVVVEAQGVLLDHLQPPIFQQRERSRVRHVRVEDARRMRIRQVNARVDVERSLLILALAGEDAASAIERQEVGRGYFAPMQPISVEKKATAGQHHAEMVANALVQIEAHSEAEGSRQVDAHRLLQGARGEVVNAAHRRDYREANKKGARRRLFVAAGTAT